MPRAHELRLAARPTGWPVIEDFELADVDVPDPAAGEVLVRNELLSVDPYMRGRMNDAPSYVPPFRLGEVMEGGAVGVVEASLSPDLAKGDVVLHHLGWRELAVGPARSFRRIDTALAPPSAYLGPLGMPGLTAYIGMLEVAALRPGDVVFVSGAAGAVGSLAGQIARLRGASRVIGSAGSAAKVAWLHSELGFDEAFNYKDRPVRDQLASAAPDGIDVYLDNVGGDHLEAAIGAMRTFGRIAVCGAIATYNDDEPPPGPRNLFQLVVKRLTMRGFLVGDHRDRMADAAAELTPWLADGRLRFRETVVDGLHCMPEAFLGMLRGENTGKMLVRLAG